MAVATFAALAAILGGLYVARIAVYAQQQTAPVGSGFVLDAEDLRFIYQQILVAQDHAAGGTLLGPGPNQVADPQLPRGLRTVDGRFNNLVPTPDQHLFGAADLVFPRLTTPVFRNAELDGNNQPTSYANFGSTVVDSQPRTISNLIVDQTSSNPAAQAAADNPCGSGGFVCSGASDPDPESGALFIPNITPDFGLSAPFNLMFTFFGQFFDHGLDLVTKGGGTVIMPLQADDPLIVGPDGLPGTQDDPPNPPPPGQRFMVLSRGSGPIVNGVQETINQTTPWVDQNQTYTSHPSHQVFLREYILNGAGRPQQTGKVLDGGHCVNRPTLIPGDQICNIGNWEQVKFQARTILGIRLTDMDVLDVPLLKTDYYGHFIPGPNGFAQIAVPAPGPTGVDFVEGNPGPSGAGMPIPANAFRTGHAFLNDIAHTAVPAASDGTPLTPDANTTACGGRFCTTAQGEYDNELLDAHFVTGDGRGNENIALTMVHQLFHAEHNRLAFYIDDLIHKPGVLTGDEVLAWETPHAGSGWDYGERLFQAARFVTEMEYQHLVFEEFARKMQPLINPFLGGITSINPAITAEFAHTVYRLGHSMLPERVGRINANGGDNEIRLLDAFLNPLEYNNGGTVGTLNAAEAAGALIRGLSQQVGNELDEFVTESVRNTLLGLPLDLPAINLARGRSEGIAPLNSIRRQLFAATEDPAVAPYADWNEFRLGLRHDESFVNFVAAYGRHPSITAATSAADKRAAAGAIVSGVGAPPDATDFLNSTGNWANGNAAHPKDADGVTRTGLGNVDFWMGGLAEKYAVFGGLLGSTFNYVFELQLEQLQDGDRFYYLQRTDGLNLKTQLEGNSLAELARRNTNVGGTMDVIFNTADFTLDSSDFPASETTAHPLGDGITVTTLADGTKVFFDPLHGGKNIVINGTNGNDKWRADVGDDSMFGNGGNDRLDGYEGNDTLLGGAGDDVLLGGNGDDVLKGGPGNDALQSGPGFGGDILLGGDGDDFMVGGNDGNEFFAGPGNDIIIDGTMRAEAILGDGGDDWLDDGDGHDGGMFGDGGNVFDLLAGLSAAGGDDVLGGGPGQDNHFGEGGDDLMLMSEGSNKFFGDFGFDWITLRGWGAPQFVELDLLANPNLPLNFNDLRNRYRFVDGASGWDLNDHIAGSNNVLCEPPGEVAECLIVGMELTTAGAQKIAGLTDLMDAFGVDLNSPAIQDVKGVGFMGGDILLGGKGSDTLEGKKGDDLIDGDVWLNVQLQATLRDANGVVTGTRLVNSPRDLITDVFSSPQRLNPHDIVIVKTIVTPPTIPGDCNNPTPLNCDTAVFSFPRADYLITENANGTVTVQHVPAVPADVPASDGTDTLRNIERLVFSDGAVVGLAGSGINNPATGNVTLSDITPTEDQVLTAGATLSDPNGWTPGSQVYDWEVETTPGLFVLVATGPSFTPRDPEVGHRLRVSARFTDNDGFSESVPSLPTLPVANINDVPTGAPQLSQTLPQEAEAITANTSLIGDADGLTAVSFLFQWQQSALGGGTTFTNIAGAAAQLATFTPGQGQVNRNLRVRVTFIDNHSTQEAINSAATGIVGDVFTGTAAGDTTTGTAGRDLITGGDGADNLTSGAGNDVVSGGTGADNINAGGGADVINAGPDNDSVNAGAGNDVIEVGPGDGFDAVIGGTGTDEIRATANDTVIGLRSLSEVEQISGGVFTNVTIAGNENGNTLNFSTVTITNIDRIDGGGGSDVITGTAQADHILGGTGADTITGGNGADWLEGGDDADTLNGGGGNDIIDGGAGPDTMNGGNGNDNFIFGPGSGADVINSFDSNATGGQDLLDISAYGITALDFATSVTIAATPTGTNTVITIGTNTIRLNGVARNTVNITDFILAPTP